MKIKREQWESLTPEQRAQAEIALAGFADAAKVNALIRYVPHEKQATFHGSFDPIKAIFAGNRFGKTTAAVVDAIIQSVEISTIPERLRPFKKWHGPFFCRFVAPDFTGTMEGVIFEKIKEWAPKSELLGGSWESAYNKQHRVLHWRNGSWWQFMTYEQDLNKFGGAALHRVSYDEEPPEDIRQECAARLIDFGGEEVFTLTPLNGLSWIFDDIYERRHDDDVFVVEASTTENPHLDARAMAQFFAGLTDEELQARRDGKFVHMAGLVFPDFDDSKHVIDPLPSMIGPEDHSDNPLWARDFFVGIDPGIRWTGVSFNAFDRHGDQIVFDELLLTDSVVPNTARAIKAKLGDWGIPESKVRYVIDPSARNRTLTTGENVEGEFARFGIHCLHGQNDVETGIFQMKRRLQGDPIGIRIARNCKRTLWEIGRYRRKEQADGSFAILKKDDHVLDALRYVSMQRPYVHALPMGRAHRDSREYREQFLQRVYEGGHPMGPMA